jgi:hypothetical protein
MSAADVLPSAATLLVLAAALGWAWCKHREIPLWWAATWAVIAIAAGTVVAIAMGDA